MSQIKSFFYLVKTKKSGVIMSILLIYMISFFFQYELSLYATERDGSAVFRMAELTVPIAFLLIFYSVFSALFHSETAEIIFSLDKSTKLWYLPLSIVLFLLICAPLFAWYVYSFDNWPVIVIKLMLLSLLYGGIFSLLVFGLHQTLLSMLIVFGLHLLFHLVLPYNRINPLTMLIGKPNLSAVAHVVGFLMPVLALARIKEKKYFE